MRRRRIAENAVAGEGEGQMRRKPLPSRPTLSKAVVRERLLCDHDRSGEVGQGNKAGPGRLHEFIHRLADAHIAAIFVVVHEDIAAGAKTLIKPVQAGTGRVVEIDVEADEGEGFLDPSAVSGKKPGKNLA